MGKDTETRIARTLLISLTKYFPFRSTFLHAKKKKKEEKKLDVAPSQILISYSDPDKAARRGVVSRKDLERHARAPCCIWIEKIRSRAAFVITCLRQNLKSFDTWRGRRTRGRAFVEMWVTLHTCMRIVPVAVLGIRMPQ